MKSLEKKRIIVAGAATGIGAATAKYLAREGAHVLVGDIDTEGAKRIAAEINSAAGHALAVTFDLTDENSIQSMVETGVTTFGGLDGLANVAADVRPQTMMKDVNVLGMDTALWTHVLRTNLIGFALTIKASLPHLMAAGDAAIVNVSSAGAWTAERQWVAYSTSKSGGHALTRHVARTWGKQGVRCNSVAPGAVLSESGAAVMPDEYKAEMLAKICLPRLGNPLDLASAIGFLLSDAASWITGQVFSIDGGLTMRE